MYPRTEYEMTQADLDTLLSAMKPVPYMIVGGHAPSSQQENANRAWASLGAKMGFDHMTSQPIVGKGARWFSAIPSETEHQRDARLAREADEKKAERIVVLNQEIADRQRELDTLTVATNVS